MEGVQEVKNSIEVYLNTIRNLKTYYSDNNQLLSKIYHQNSDGVFAHQALLNDLRKLLIYGNYNLSKIKDIKKDMLEDTNVLRNQVNSNNRLYTREKQKEQLYKMDSEATQIQKVNQYDVNIVDNMYIIYYFLSFGIIGLFNYKLLKQ